MIPLHRVLIAPDAHIGVNRTLYSGLLTEGPRVKEFEARLKGFLGCDVLATNSCTSAIDLALHLCGVGPGDQVISTPLTCSATNTHVLLRGAQLVWCDVDPNGLATFESIMNRVTPRTKAIIVVDWGGRPVDCDKIRCSLLRPVPIIQDAAHSFGARCGGGDAHSNHTSGDYVCWSFQAIKHLTTGDGGALKVPRQEIARARALRWFGIDRDIPAKFRFLQDIPEAGYKYHMNDLAASLGLANFDAAVKSLEAYRENARWLFRALGGCRTVQTPEPDNGSSWWFYSLRTPDRFGCIDFLESRGIGCGPVHGRNDVCTAYDRSHHPLPGVDNYNSSHVAIPCGWWLTKENLEVIAATVLEWDKQL